MCVCVCMGCVCVCVTRQSVSARSLFTVACVHIYTTGGHHYIQARISLYLVRFIDRL